MSDFTVTLTPEQIEELRIDLHNAQDVNAYDTLKKLYIKDYGTVGKQLRGLRLRAGISIHDLSRQVGVSESFMCKVENGQMKLTKMEQLRLWVKGLGFDEVIIRL